MSNLVKKYFKGDYCGHASIFSSLSDELDSLTLSTQQLGELEKLLQVFFLGQLVGLPTLQAMLTKFGIKSNHRQYQYKKLCKALSISKIRMLFEAVFSYSIEEKLKEMAQKDSSCWSRELTTVILDDSVFRSWFQSQDFSADFDDFYGKFFSGQFGSAVYGFKVVTLGTCIDGIFYPQYFDFVKKKSPGKPKPKTAVEVAGKLVIRWGEWKEKLNKNGILLPRIHLSCDSGYSNPDLAKTCAENGICYISVPKKSHNFEIDNQKIKLSNWIEQIFIPAEKEHLKKQEFLPDEQKTPFQYRVRARYCSKKQEVTLLIFRLKGSKKVTAIYTPDKHIFAKTLRRHWFQRTYIEQFFKTLKHVLKIQEARINKKDDFEIKLLRFAFVAIHVQQIVRFLRKKITAFRGKGFISIQRMLSSDPDFLDLLQDSIKVKS